MDKEQAKERNIAEISLEEQKIRESLTENRHLTPIMIQVQFVNTLLDMHAHDWQSPDSISIERIAYEIQKYKYMVAEEMKKEEEMKKDARETVPSV